VKAITSEAGVQHIPFCRIPSESKINSS